MTGTLADNPDSVSYTFVNEQVQDVTFTDCDSNFDPKLFLIDSSGNYIQDQSTNNCDGDDCYDYSICSVARTETFTMEQLAAGTYTVYMTPWNYGGDYSLQIYCAYDPVGETSTSTTTTTTTTTTEMPSANPTGDPTSSPTTATPTTGTLCHFAICYVLCNLVICESPNLLCSLSLYFHGVLYQFPFAKSLLITVLNSVPSENPTESPSQEPTESEFQFIVGTEYMTFSDAENWCVAQGEHLASIHSAQENAAAVAQCSDCWIGLHCVGNSQFDFEWTDGSDWDYTNWNSGEPNNWQNKNEDCVHMYSTGYWNDHTCDQLFRPLCAVSDGMLPITFSMAFLERIFK